MAAIDVSAESWSFSSISILCLPTTHLRRFIMDWSFFKCSWSTECTERTWSFNDSWLTKFSRHNGHFFPSASPWFKLSVGRICSIRLISSSARKLDVKKYYQYLLNARIIFLVDNIDVGYNLPFSLSLGLESSREPNLL